MRPISWVSIGILTLAGLGLLLRSLTIKIEPGQTGVVNAEWTAGLVQQDFGPGYAWDIGPLHTWTVFNTTVQTLNMSRGNRADEGPLQVKSSDGATVTLDVTIKYRIKEGSTWRVLQENGPGDAYKLKVRNETIDVLRRELGGLKTEEFYDPHARAARAQSMENTLRGRLDAMHVTLENVLIRDLKFDEAFEQRIREKTLAQQEVEVNQARTEAAKERGKTNEVIAQTQAKVVVIQQEKEKTLATMTAENDKAIAQVQADAQRKEIEVRSGADLYAAEKKAVGDLEIKRAEAQAERMRREALSGVGADVYVALQLVRSLKLGDMLLSTQALDPLDVPAMLRRFGMK